MESVTSSLESVSETKVTRSLDRVTLGEGGAAKIDCWLKQLQEASRGYLSLSRSDLVRFIVQEHRNELSPAEIKRLRIIHYDPVRHIQWLMPQLKAALAASDAARVAELQDELRGIQLPGASTERGGEMDAVKMEVPRGCKRTKKTDESEALDETRMP